jgi:hypothetical protein
MLNILVTADGLLICITCLVLGSVVDPNPDPPEPRVYWPPGSGFISQRYGSGSFYHHAKIVRKTLIPTIL